MSVLFSTSFDERELPVYPVETNEKGPALVLFSAR